MYVAAWSRVVVRRHIRRYNPVPSSLNLQHARFTVITVQAKEIDLRRYGPADLPAHCRAAILSSTSGA